MKETYVYIIQCGDSEVFKIGISSDPNKRLSDLQTANPYLLTICYIAEFEDRERAQTVEHLFHNWFKNHRMYGEWFGVKPESIVEAWEHVSKALSALGASIPSLTKINNISKPDEIEQDATRGLQKLTKKEAIALCRENIEMIHSEMSASEICVELGIDRTSLRTMQRAIKFVTDETQNVQVEQE